MERSGRALFGVILPIVFLDTTLLSVVNPMLPLLLERIMGAPPSQSSYLLGLLMATFALSMFISAPFLGTLSDKIGRRPVILLALGAAVIDHLINAVASSVAVLFIARALAGACTSLTAAAYAYTADVSTDGERTRWFGLLGAIASAGFILGPGIGGVLGERGTRVPFLFAAALSAASLVYAACMLRESLPRARRLESATLLSNPLAPFSVLFGAGGLGTVATILFLLGLSISIGSSTWILFVQSQFSWDARQIGFALVVLGLTGLVAQALAPRLISRLRGERTAVIFGLTCAIGSNAIYPLIHRGWQVYLSAPFTAMSYVAGIALQALASRQVTAEIQGRLQGAFLGLNSISLLVGPLIGTTLFGYFTSPATRIHLPSAGFCAAILCLMCAIVVAWRLPPARVAATERAVGILARAAKE